jgi:alpha-aminoadipic semialdehyde synthase
MLKAVIRKEYKNEWEKRTALVPKDTAELVKQGLPVRVEPSDIRVFSDEAYSQLDIPLGDGPAESEFVIGIKEPPVNSILPGQVHLAFSHTIKGQDYNMGLLQKFIDEKATLIDYEVITGDNGKRTIAFGRFAGIAGAIDSFFVAGKKYTKKGQVSCLSDIKQTWQYDSIHDIKAEFKKIDVNQGEPVQVLIVGTGNVGKGSEEVCQWLGLPKIDIQELLDGDTPPQGSWYAVASSRHINTAIDGSDFDMQDFIYRGIEGYTSCFDKLLGKFQILLQTPYWTKKYPKHLDKQRMLAHKDKLPLVIGDISCDIDGSLECTSRISDIDNPAYTYDVEKDTEQDGIHADGISVMAIDNLPCELSMDASEYFSAILKDYSPNLLSMDLNKPFDDCGLVSDLEKAVIVYKGELTPNFKYLQPFLDQHLAK